MSRAEEDGKNVEIDEDGGDDDDGPLGDISDDDDGNAITEAVGDTFESWIECANSVPFVGSILMGLSILYAYFKENKELEKDFKKVETDFVMKLFKTLVSIEKMHDPDLHRRMVLSLEEKGDYPDLEAKWVKDKMSEKKEEKKNGRASVESKTRERGLIKKSTSWAPFVVKLIVSQACERAKRGAHKERE